MFFVTVSSKLHTPNCAFALSHFLKSLGFNYVTYNMACVRHDIFWRLLSSFGVLLIAGGMDKKERGYRETYESEVTQERGFVCGPWPL